MRGQTNQAILSLKLQRTPARRHDPPTRNKGFGSDCVRAKSMTASFVANILIPMSSSISSVLNESLSWKSTEGSTPNRTVDATRETYC